MWFVVSLIIEIVNLNRRVMTWRSRIADIVLNFDNELKKQNVLAFTVFDQFPIFSLLKSYVAKELGNAQMLIFCDWHIFLTEQAQFHDIKANFLSVAAENSSTV